MKFSIEPITEHHFPRLIELITQFATFQKSKEKLVNSVEKMHAEKSFLNGFVAVTEADEILGYTTCFFAYFTWSGKSVYLDDLYVEPEYRGWGVGKALIESVIAFARQENCYKVHWQVSRWNKSAMAFYKSLGAEIDDTEYNCDLIL